MTHSRPYFGRNKVVFFVFGAASPSGSATAYVHTRRQQARHVMYQREPIWNNYYIYYIACIFMSRNYSSIM